MKKFWLILAVLFYVNCLSQDKYITRNGMIQFNASTPLETISPINNHVSCILDPETGKIAFQLKMISFKFDKALMEEHFNEKYVESEKYPKSTFVGEIINWNELSTSKEKQNVISKGILTIHGVEKEVEVSGTINLRRNDIKINSEFSVLVSDFDIKIPKLVRDKISKEVRVILEMNLQSK
ncbi:MAG: hypothetical protein CMD02_07905 [Flavobacteriales bacterium]|nr:hypothetical protein [Flavobacteriales bacterium]|tara:strand:+ start:2672 stop:3214 length:543 start_codon:yes stop_codon:yes gene_type:complete